MAECGPSQEKPLAEIINGLPLGHRARVEYAQLAIALGNAQTALVLALPIVLLDCTDVSDFEKLYPEEYELYMGSDNTPDGVWGKHCAQVSEKICEVL